jgi:hypothetical protein
VVIRRARERAAAADVDAEFAIGDFTATAIESVDGRLDLISTSEPSMVCVARAAGAMARTVTRLSRPGSLLLGCCLCGVAEELQVVRGRNAARRDPRMRCP